MIAIESIYNNLTRKDLAFDGGEKRYEVKLFVVDRFLGFVNVRSGTNIPLGYSGRFLPDGRRLIKWKNTRNKTLASLRTISNISPQSTGHDVSIDRLEGTNFWIFGQYETVQYFVESEVGSNSYKYWADDTSLVNTIFHTQFFNNTESRQTENSGTGLNKGTMANTVTIGGRTLTLNQMVYGQVPQSVLEQAKKFLAEENTKQVGKYALIVVVVVAIVLVGKRFIK